jgi:hypothetical protein
MRLDIGTKIKIFIVLFVVVGVLVADYYIKKEVYAKYVYESYGSSNGK